MSPRSNRKTSNWSAVNFKKHLTSMSCTTEPAIWSRDTGQQIPCFDRCQLIITCLMMVSNIEDITCPRVDMNFIFEWSTRYLTSERSERVRYRVDHEKIKFISISGHVMFCLLYKHQWNTKPFYFNIFNGLKVERVVTKHGRSTWTKTKFIW